MIKSGPRLDFQEFIRSRRSIRRFRPDPIPVEILDRILETTCWAPSAHNRQPWRLAILSSIAVRTELAKRMGAAYARDLRKDGMNPEDIESIVKRSRERITGAPAAILLCADLSIGDLYPDPERELAEYLMGVQGVALAGGTLLLAAHAEGLGSVWVCAPLFAQEVIRNFLELPDSWQPQALILLGYPLDIPGPRPRRPLSEIVRYIS
jgi:F420 biosynthesis protein FbiB-like protein